MILRSPLRPVTLLIAAGMSAQEPLPDPRTLIPIDHVVATINDAVILNSEIQTLALGEARTRELQRGRKLDAEEMRFILHKNLQLKIDQHTLAQAAKTLGIRAPEDVERLFQEQLMHEERQMRRQLGSYQKLSEELARQNRTWQAFEREKRVSVMADMARWMAVDNRFQNQRHLFITPRMMRLFYKHNRDLFVHGGAAIVGGVSFQGPDAEALAREAAAIWREEPLLPDELAQRFGDRGEPLPERTRVDDDNKDSLLTELAEFGLAGPIDRVSDPVPVGGRYKVWKILDYRGARDDRFDDPEVQREIRNRLESQVMQHLLDQTLSRARARTHVWRSGQ